MPSPPIPEWLQIVRDLGASLARTLFCPLPGQVSRLNSSCRPSIWCSEIFVFSFFFSLLNFFFFFSLHHWSIAFLLSVSSLRSPSWFGPCQRGQNHNYPGPSSNRPGIGALNFFFFFLFIFLSFPFRLVRLAFSTPASQPGSSRTTNAQRPFSAAGPRSLDQSASAPETLLVSFEQPRWCLPGSCWTHTFPVVRDKG